MHSNIVRKALQAPQKVFGKPCMHSEYEAIRLPEHPQKVNKKTMHAFWRFSGDFLGVRWLKIVPGAFPGPPRGLPGASLEPPEAILENSNATRKNKKKQKVSPDPIFQKNVKFTDSGWTPKSLRSGPESEKKTEKRRFV